MEQTVLQDLLELRARTERMELTVLQERKEKLVLRVLPERTALQAPLELQVRMVRMA